MHTLQIALPEVSPLCIFMEVVFLTACVITEVPTSAKRRQLMHQTKTLGI